MPLYLDETAVRACLPDSEIFEVVTATLAQLGSGRAISGPKAGFSINEDGDARYLGTVSGYVAEQRVAGVKWFVTAQRNSTRGLPSVLATLLICDATTGVLAGVIDATQLTAARTAAMAVAAALRAARREPTRAAVVGVGRIGKAIVRYLITHTAVDEIVVHGRNAAAARDACRDAPATASRPVRVHAVTDLATCVPNADLIFTATNVVQDTPLIRAEWLTANSVVCTMGSLCEVHDAVIGTAAQIVVDDPEGVQRRGCLASEMSAGRMSPERISGTVADLISAGRSPGPVTAHTLVVLVGLGVLDVALGGRALQNARRLGVGVDLGGGQGAAG